LISLALAGSLIIIILESWNITTIHKQKFIETVDILEEVFGFLEGSCFRNHGPNAAKLTML